jgi:hypothetical protein
VATKPKAKPGSGSGSIAVAPVKVYVQPSYKASPLNQNISVPFQSKGAPVTGNSVFRRGFMIWDDTIAPPSGYDTPKGSDPNYPARVQFFFNPSTVSTSYQVADGSAQAALNYGGGNSSLDGGALLLPIQQQTSFTLMFDRSYEMVYAGTSMVSSLSATDQANIANYGVDVDIAAIRQYTGMFAGVYSGNQNYISYTPSNVVTSSTGKSETNPNQVKPGYNAPLGKLSQGIMQVTLGYVYFSGPTSASVGGAGSATTGYGITYYGYIDSWDVEYCLDDSTQILTRRGWLYHHELLSDDECLGIDPTTKVISWQPIESVHRFNHDGDMIHWHNSHGFDALSTEQHRWLMAATDRFKRTWELSDTRENIQSGGGYPQCFISHPVYSDEFVELIGWTVTEGWYPKGSSLGVRIGQSIKKNPEKAQRLVQLAKYFSDLGATTSQYDRKSMIDFYFGKGIGNLIRQAAPDKQLTPEFLCSLTKHQAELLYETMLSGDGNRSKTSTRFTQKDQGRIDGFQMLASMLGNRTCAKAHKGTSVQDVTVYKRTVTNTASLTETKEYYRGVVWCPKTPTQTWLARRNGGTFWTGNTHFSSNMIPMRAVVDISFTFLPPPAQAPDSKGAAQAAQQIPIGSQPGQKTAPVGNQPPLPNSPLNGAPVTGLAGR